MTKPSNSYNLSIEGYGKTPRSLPLPATPTTEEPAPEGWDLGWLFGVVRRRLWVMVGVMLLVFVPSAALLVKKARQVVPLYEGHFQLLVEPINDETKISRILLLAQSPRQGTRGFDYTQFTLDYETQIRVLRSPNMMAPVIERLKKHYPSITHNLLMQDLTITRLTYDKDGKQEGTKILDIKYQNSDSKKVELVLNELSHAYLEYSLLERQAIFKHGIKFIDSQLPALQRRVDNLQLSLQTLRQRYDLFDPEASNDQINARLTRIEQQRTELASQLADARKRYQTTIEQLQAGNTTTVLSEQGKAYESLLSRAQQLEIELTTEKARMTEDNPRLLNLQEEQQNVHNFMLQEAHKLISKLGDQVRILEAQQAELDRISSRLQQLAAELPIAARQYTDLKRQLEVASTSLSEFLGKREALQIDSAQQEIPWELVSPPNLVKDETGKPLPMSASNTKRSLILTMVLSTLLGIGAGFIVEILDQVFHTPEESKRGTKLPVLGVIPIQKRAKLRAMMFVEAFRSLYTNIYLLNPECPVQSVAICSTTPGDGKTTVALNLGQTIAAVGARVLLVDGDLRRPQMHQRLGLSNDWGLSDVLVRDLPWQEAIHPFSNSSGETPFWAGNLFVLTAGAVPADPIKLLSSKQMRSLVKQLQSAFDLVIYDTPPLAGLADANLIAAYADGTILVVALGKTNRTSVNQALDELRNSGANLLGVVANGLNGYLQATYASRK